MLLTSKLFLIMSKQNNLPHSGIDANNSSLRSFIEVDKDSHFPIQNLPFGIFSDKRKKPRIGIAIGDYIFDLALANDRGLINVDIGSTAESVTLNEFINLGRAKTSLVRQKVSEILRHDNPLLRDNNELRNEVLVPMNQAEMHMPLAVGAFSDFMLSKEHSLNCVDIVGGSKNGNLWPNWTYLPIAYNARASSIVISGTDVKRPWGQVWDESINSPRYQPTRKLDFELEAAIVIGQGNKLGSPIGISSAESHAFGVVLLNDWSTRDIQAWEAQPLGVFVSKSHRTSISPWVVTLDALEAFRVNGPVKNPEPLPHLRQAGAGNFDVHMQASITPQNHSHESVVCRSNMKDLYWSFAQQITHHTSTGCNLQTGDLLATGTVSSSGHMAQGCLYEATRDGREEVLLERGGKRMYLEDGDKVVLSAWAQADGYRVGFGECTGRVTPADSEIPF